MGFFGDHAVGSTIASIFVIWLVSKIIALLRDRQRIGKFVSDRAYILHYAQYL
jgi:hypothetical protein